MLNGNKSKSGKPRNFVAYALTRVGSKAVAHGKTKKAERRAAEVALRKGEWA
jgi:hypothetical protein